MGTGKLGSKGKRDKKGYSRKNCGASVPGTRGKKKGREAERNLSALQKDSSEERSTTKRRKKEKRKEKF